MMFVETNVAPLKVILKRGFLFQKVGYVAVAIPVAWRWVPGGLTQRLYTSSFWGITVDLYEYGINLYQCEVNQTQNFRMSPMSSLKPKCLVHGVVSSRLALRLKVPECGMHAQALQSA